MREGWRNIRLLIEYDGSDFWGFQVQPGGRTVQGVLQAALGRLTGEPVKVIGAGRTDSRVHALGQVVNFHTGCSIPPERYAPALNRLLPADLRVRESGEVSPEFHARYSARSKTYRYLVYRRREGAVLQRNYALVLDGRLEVEAMREAARCLTGRQSFKSFCASNSGVRNYVRTVREFLVEEQGDWLRFEVTADGFLYHMVRNMVGTLLEVGTGRRRPEEMGEIIMSQDRARAGATAPAQGLYLVRIEYPEAFS
ncbi:MAG: tRNA pseudouridine(38-40) synthase TruA [Syntrophomonadaceae bacterium]|nr:tRNA pseudouridine(38-40) synthase TruA [Syntrophomonadaceae bacterium]